MSFQTHLVPISSKVSVYLAGGNWAWTLNSDPDWGKRIPAATYLRTHWPQYRLTAGEQAALANTVVYVVYHPHYAKRNPAGYWKQYLEADI
jgi:hypothetical protein